MRLLLCVFLFVSLFSLSADKGVRDSFTELQPGEPRGGAIRTRSQAWYETYKFLITPETLGATLTLEGAQADLDLYVKFGSPMEDYSETDAYSETEEFNESLRLFRYGESGLEDGYAYVDVAYMLESPPVADQKVLRDISYTITLELVESQPEQPLREDRPVGSTLHPEGFMIRTFPLEIPRRAGSLRLDLYNTTGDLDIMVTQEPVIPSNAQPLYLSESVAGNESLVMDLERRHRGETLYVSIFDSISDDRIQEFFLVTRFSREAPPFLLDLPVWETGLSPRDNAFAATVELIADGAGGSGTILSADGVILTNYHVLVRPEGGLSEEVIVAVVEEWYAPAVEQFRARVLEASEKYDCALLKITSGYYGQEIPQGYRFPHYRLGSDKDLSPGDEIRIIGFPTIGGSGSRPTLNLSRGILSGGEMIEDGYVLKTDALISGGNSGGAAVDGEFRLLGIPSFVIEEDTESLGYIIPLSRIPSAWFDRHLP